MVLVTMVKIHMEIRAQVPEVALVVAPTQAQAMVQGLIRILVMVLARRLVIPVMDQVQGEIPASSRSLTMVIHRDHKGRKATVHPLRVTDMGRNTVLVAIPRKDRPRVITVILDMVVVTHLLVIKTTIGMTEAIRNLVFQIL
jgi:hypothetical protein